MHKSKNELKIELKKRLIVRGYEPLTKQAMLMEIMSTVFKDIINNNCDKSNVKSTSICGCCKEEEATLCDKCVADAIELVVT